MDNFNLSYIISTKNRLPFLKILLERLLPELKESEEVVVVDGGSTDGSKEFLQSLINANKIHQYLSEPDENQAHGWNKAMLLARGTLIKKLIDDDVYDFNAIRFCEEYMRQDPEIDVCISNCLQSDLDNADKVVTSSREQYYRQWEKGLINAFTFSDVSMLLRRSSLSLIGLYDTQFTMIDWEYALRISFLHAKIVYYTGYNSLSVSTPGNITLSVNKKILKYEETIGKIKYKYAGDSTNISWFSHIKIRVGKTLSKLQNKDTRSVSFQLPEERRLKEMYSSYYKTIAEFNGMGSFSFLE